MNDLKTMIHETTDLVITSNICFCEKYDWQMCPPPPNITIRYGLFGLIKKETKQSKEMSDFYKNMLNEWKNLTVEERKIFMTTLNALIKKAD